MNPVGKTSLRLLLLLASLIIATSCSTTPEEKTEPDVIFVPTPHRVVREMLKLADVKKDDVVYDLGSGDGRVVIAAARDFAARGVGIELDQRLVSASIENAKHANVAERVRFYGQDMFKADISEATVVTLFLLSEMNKMLAPKFLKELKPGTRIVSHLFEMGDWKPDITLKAYHSTIHLWLVPADVNGDWGISVVNEEGTWQCAVTIQQDYQKLHARKNSRKIRFREMKLYGREISMLIEDDSSGRKSFITLEGLVREDTMEGIAHITGGSSTGKYSWMGVRISKK
jgi:hypothetical protein